MSWKKRVNLVLEREPETWLTYLYGQRLNDLPHLLSAKPRFRGGFTRLLVYLYSLIKSTSWRYTTQSGHADFLIYAGSHNQKSALNSTVDELKLKGRSVVAVCPERWMSKEDREVGRYFAMQYDFKDLFRTLVLLISRFGFVFRSVRKIDVLLIRNRLDTFLQVHHSLVYFDRLLDHIQPRYVVVSNDHNFPNRSILALARLRGIKTVYMQHASVSSVFPALNVDYAFLDGMNAMETYAGCENNFPASDTLLPTRLVFLTGQKKQLRVVRSGNDKVVGLALNSLDKLTDIHTLIETLSSEGFRLKVRWHPGLSEKTLLPLRALLNSCQVGLSDPHKEDLGAFFASVTVLIAGNSSIHLEAALTGVVSVYYEVSETKIPDYYGYVARDVSVLADNQTELHVILRQVQDGSLIVNKAAVAHYSATSGTEWEGREGELVAEILIGLDTDMKELPVMGKVFPST